MHILFVLFEHGSAGDILAHAHDPSVVLLVAADAPLDHLALALLQLLNALKA